MTVTRRSVPGLRRTAAGRSVADRIRSPTAGTVRAVGGSLAAITVCLLAAVRLGLNAPLGQSPAGIQIAHTVASTAAVLLPGVAAVAVGVSAESDWTLVGLVATGTFAILAALVPAAGAAAVSVVPIAAVLVMAPAVPGDDGWSVRQTPFAILVIAGVVTSLGAEAGLFAVGVRSLGTIVSFLGFALAPVAVAASPRAVLVGGCVAVAIAIGAAVAPFVAGAVFLAVGAAIDPPVLVAAAGVGGCAAVVSEGVRHRAVPLVAGGLLLLGAGVPATVPRAVAVVLGAHLLLATPGSVPGATTRGDPS